MYLSAVRLATLTPPSRPIAQASQVYKGGWRGWYPHARVWLKTASRASSMLTMGDIHTRSAAWPITYAARRSANASGPGFRARASRHVGSIDPSSGGTATRPSTPRVGHERARRSPLNSLGIGGGSRSLTRLAWRAAARPARAISRHVRANGDRGPRRLSRNGPGPPPGDRS